MTIPWIRAVLFVASLYIIAPIAVGDELDRELAKIDALRAKGPAPIDKVEELGKELLVRHPDQKAQGRIYYQLAFTLAQSGITKNQDQLTQYFQKALELNQDPKQRAILFCFYGDLLSVKKGDFPTQRRAAAEMYLRGLKELINLQLPEGPIEIPEVDGMANEELQAIQMKARNEAKYFAEMAMHRKVLAGQLVYVYARTPENLQEFQTAAQKILGDAKQVEAISKAIEAETAKRIEITKTRQNLKPKAAPDKKDR